MASRVAGCVVRQAIRWIVAAALLLLVWSVQAGAVAEGSDETAMREPRLTDFASLQTRDSPNAWLVAPPAYTAAKPNEDAADFAIDAVRLADAWQTVLRQQPRTTISLVSADGLQIEAEQRSAVFGFVDDISFRAIPLAADLSTVAIYSRARVGYWDLGVNRRRVRAWIELLGEQLA